MSSVIAPRGSYEKGVRRRELIVQTALEVFAERGYTNGSMREIATRAGLAQGGLLHHFTNKSELLTEVLTLRDHSIDAALERSGAATLRDQLLVIVEHNSSNRHLTTLFTLLSAEATNEEHDAHRYFTERYERQFHGGVASIVQEQAAGHIRANVDAETAAAALIALVDGLQLQQELRRGVDPVEILRRYWADYLQA